MHLLGAEVVSTEGVKSQRGGNKHDKIRNWEYIGFVLRKRCLRGVLLWGGIISSLKSSYRLKVGASIFLEEDETETTFLGRRRVRLGPILFTTHKIERRKGTTALNSEIKLSVLKIPLKAWNDSTTQEALSCFWRYMMTAVILKCAYIQV